MRATPIACTLALLLAACGTQAPAEPAAAPAASAPAEPAAMPEPTPPADAPPATDAVPPAAAGAPAADETPMVLPAMAGTCDASALGWAIGQPGDDALLARAKAESGAAHAQFLRPGMAMTMDYRPDRLVIDLDEDGRVSATRCG